MSEVESRQRDRSSIKFPYRDLGECLEVAEIIYSRFGGSCQSDQLAAATNYSSANNGAFTQKLAAMGHYGLTNREGSTIRLTERGLAVVQDSTSASAKVDAFMDVPLYAAVYERFKGQKLPGTAGLENVMKELGVTSATVANARQVMARSARQAGFMEFGEDRLVMPTARSVQASVTEPIVSEVAALPILPEPPATNSELTDLHKSSLHPAIIHALETLPRSGTDWQFEELEDWLDGFQGVLRLVYKVKRPK